MNVNGEIKLVCFECVQEATVSRGRMLDLVAGARILVMPVDDYPGDPNDFERCFCSICGQACLRTDLPPKIPATTEEKLEWLDLLEKISE